MKNDKQTPRELKERQSASLALPASAYSLKATPVRAKLSRQLRGENTRNRRGCMSVHSVFVLAVDGKPLTPTTPARARRLLKDSVAKRVWSKFGQFGIQMLVNTRRETPTATLGVDHGTKFEGYAVVCGKENSLSVKLDLPDKQQIVRKLEERRQLRRARRYRNCRRRPARFDNRKRDGFLAPSQAVIVNARLKVLRELLRCYPISAVGFEDVRFNHAEYRWGANFSTVEIGKAKIKSFLEQKAEVFDFQAFETQEIRQKYGYRKTKDKAADKFTAHCSDALALAVEVGVKEFVEPGRFLVVDDTYRPVRRKLHDTQPSIGDIRADYSRGVVFGLRKGLLIGTLDGRKGRLCGKYRGGYRYYDEYGKRQSTKRLAWISSQFIIKEVGQFPRS